MAKPRAGCRNAAVGAFLRCHQEGRLNMRKAGVLLHPTSLPHGVIGDEVENFLDWMAQAGLTLWQMLPLTPPHADRSPYQAYSSFALNPALLPPAAAQATPDADELADFERREAFWLEDYALFVALRQQHADRAWCDWPEALRHREPEALQQARRVQADTLARLKKEQFLLQRRWQLIRQQARARGICLFGDVPIAVAYDSADVWARPQLFKLDADLQPTVVAGVPPDYFSREGQRWGNPHYNWELHQATDFAWWRQRMAAALRLFDLVRIDHFRGLQALWEIPAASPTAMEGRWVETPGRALLEALRQDFPAMPFVAEDLGLITPEVMQLRDDFGLAGLAVLQFGFDDSPDNPHRIGAQRPNCVVYTGTHDNNTSLGWFEELPAERQQQVLRQLPEEAGPMPWPLIVAALVSAADLAVVPLQDWLGLDGQHRMNVPGTCEGNWRWRFRAEQLDSILAGHIRRWLEQTGRLAPEER
jgi:4-alpha-glucanotransferase